MTADDIEAHRTRFALPDHANHIHIGFGQQADMLLEPSQWTRLLDRLGSIANPEVAG